MLDGWVAAFGENLRYVKNELGIEHVRVFLFCNGWNLGGVTQVKRFLGYSWTYEGPSPLHPRFVEQIAGMVRAASDAGVKVIPSLLDFPALGDAPTLGGRHGCACRREIVIDPAKQSRFFDTVLEPLLEAAVPLAPAVHAWEVLNEPYWLTYSLGARFARFTDHAFGGSLRSFLAAAIERITRRGFESTVGHRYHADLDRMPTGTIRQFHYYPTKDRFYLRPFVENRLPPFAETNAILGEFATELVPPGSTMGGPWPDVDLAAQQETKSRVLARLRHVEGLGYGLALLWPDRPGVAPTQPDALKLSSEAQDAVREFHR